MLVLSLPALSQNVLNIFLWVFQSAKGQRQKHGIESSPKKSACSEDKYTIPHIIWVNYLFFFFFLSSQPTFLDIREKCLMWKKQRNIKLEHIFKISFFFIHERHRERGKDTGRERSRLLMGSLMRDLIPGPRGHDLSWRLIQPVTQASQIGAFLA